ncbi:MAG: homocysteine S-methyltransferase family protein [Coriobacteriia bacterium]|nr:homocysteine S-methyltransferase family protein [Coriobacteriia bacterium]
MPDIMRRLGREMLVLDGAMGTMLQRAGISPGTAPELINVTAPEIVAQVLDYYNLAGSDCTITNSFGGSAPKLAEYGLEDRVEELNRAAVRIARSHGAPHILADMGPSGLVMEPLGSATFEEVFAAFAEQARALAAENPDAIFLETFTDIAEARCAVLAARSVTDLPVIASVTLGMQGRMDLSGTEPETAAIILEAAGASAVGLNCGLGPEQMLPLAARMVRATTVPVVVQPNAGLPTLSEDGSTVFPGTPDEMGAFAEAAREVGVAAIGSCCGSSPSFTGAIADAISDRDCVVIDDRGFGGATVLAGPRRVVALGAGHPLRVIGERINPTGKPALRDSLLEGSMSAVRAYAAAQEHAGADLLDVNVGAAGVDAAAVLPAAVLALAGGCDLPLVIDTTDPLALEAALRIYPGKALVNSVNGDPDSLDAVLPLVVKYGAAVVVLALDDTGIPADAEGRVAVARRIRSAASRLGIVDSNLVVDSLVMTAATDADAPAVTIAATRAAKTDGLSTVLGVSNVSHGLPDRPLLNAAFLTATAAVGLDAAIVNPNDHVVMEAIRLINQARAAGVDVDAHGDGWPAWEAAYATAMARALSGVSEETDSDGADEVVDPAWALEAAVLRGDAEATPGLADAVIDAGTAPEDVIGTVLTPTIQRLGDAYGRGEVFLPQMMVAADAMKAAVARVKERLPEGSADLCPGRVVFATVKGDIHSIGKDICVSLLESQGFEVHDLGVDAASEAVLEAAVGADAVCLSALMTTTLPAMQATVVAVRAAQPDTAIFVGGAVVTPEWAQQVGAGYAPDAPGCVRAVRQAIERKA